jgi:hypothetical protein
VLPFSSGPIRRAVVSLSLAGVTATIAVGAALPASGAALHSGLGHASLPSAKQLISKTLATMSGQSSVRLTIKSKDNSTKQSETVTEDVGKSTGLESIQYGTASANVRLTSQAAYISGNTAGLEHIVGLSSNGAKSVGEKWIVVKKGSSQFTGIVDGGTIGPLAKALLPTSPKSVTVKSSTFDGHDAYAMNWSTSSSGSKITLALVIASHGASLPIQLTATEGSFISVTSFGNWGETITVNVPKSTIEYSKVPK